MEHFDSQYKPVMQKIQESDEMQIYQVKNNMERFAKSLHQIGENFKVRGEEMSQAISMISIETDIKIFIEGNRSQNPVIQKEEF